MASGLRNAEPCKVVGLEYVIGSDKLENTYARVQLMLSDENLTPDLQGKSFSVDLPPSHLGQADFVIHSQRFQNSLASKFRLGHRCRVMTLTLGVLQQSQIARGTSVFLPSFPSWGTALLNMRIMMLVWPQRCVWHLR